MNETLKNTILVGIFGALVIGGTICFSHHLDGVRAKEKQAKIDANDPVLIEIEAKRQQMIKTWEKEQATQKESNAYFNKKNVFIDSSEFRMLSGSGVIMVNVINRGDKKIKSIQFEFTSYSKSGQQLETIKFDSAFEKVVVISGTLRHNFGEVLPNSARTFRSSISPQYGIDNMGSYSINISHIELE